MGKLDNGISWYLVGNRTAPGYADFALVQKGFRNPGVTREQLRSLSHFQGTSPSAFLSSNGVGYRRGGYAGYHAGSTVFRFDDVPVYDRSVADSTLLMLFDLALSSPMEQSIIISGDIDVEALKERLGVLSMMVPALEAVPAGDPYEWKPRYDMECTVETSRPGAPAVISLMYRTPRPGRELLQTTQPMVTRLFASELGLILEGRLKNRFRKSGVPFADFEWMYLGSDVTAGDELFGFRAVTDPSKVGQALGIIASTLSALDSDGADPDEFRVAKTRSMAAFTRNLPGRFLPNSYYVDKCVASCLWGASLASEASVAQLFAGRRLADATELELFNRFVTALVDNRRNLNLKVSSPIAVDADLKDEFSRAWSDPSAEGIDLVSPADTSLLRAPAKKTKLKSSILEPVTGGQQWTFSNGMNVIFKKTGDKGEFHWALLMRGGFPEVPSIAPGENAFVADMFPLCTVSGMSGDKFKALLSSQKVEMNASVGLSDFRLYGRAPSGRLQLLLKSLYSIATERGVDLDSYKYWRECEKYRIRARRQTHGGIEDMLDSLVCPEYAYLPHKTEEALSDNLLPRCASYFSARLGNLGGSTLILCGDLQEADVKKLLTRTLGDFPSGSQKFVRPRISYPQRSGWSTYTVQAERSSVGDARRGVSVKLSSQMPFNAGDYYAFRLAVVALEKSMVRSLARKGCYVTVSGSAEIFPVERFSISVDLRACPADGVPADVVPAAPLQALAAVRSTVTHLAGTSFTEADLKAGKAALLKQLEAHYADTGAIVDATLTRISEGKDLYTDYKSKVNAVTLQQVRDILTGLDRGSKVEYVIL